MRNSALLAFSFAGIIFLFAASSALLIAPHTLPPLSQALSAVGVWSSGVFLFALGNLQMAATLLHYRDSFQHGLRLATSLSLLAALFFFWRAGFFIESFWLGTLALAGLLSLPSALQRYDWIRSLMQGLHFLLGLACLLRPEWLSATLESLDSFPSQVALAGSFFISAFLSLLFSLRPSLAHPKPSRPLAVPWLLWGLLGATAGRFPQVLVSGSAAITLLWMDSLPWDKIVIIQGQRLGQRLVHLVESGNTVSLLLVMLTLRAVEGFIPGAAQSPGLLRVREVALAAFALVNFFSVLLLISVAFFINGVFSGIKRGAAPEPEAELIAPHNLLAGVINLLLQPFLASQAMLVEVVREQEEHLRLLQERTQNENRRMAQLNLLHQLNLQLEAVLDPPVSAQLTANLVAASLNGSLCAVLEYVPEREELQTLAASGPQAANIPPGYRQSARQGLLGRAVRLRRTQLASDVRLDADYFSLNGGSQEGLSEVIVPLLYYNQVRGALLLDAPQTNAFDDSDIRSLETIGVLLVTAWERSEHEERLTRLIEGRARISTTLEIEDVMRELASLAQETLDARFVFLALVDKGGGFTRMVSAGSAPTLERMLSSDPEGNRLIQSVLRSPKPLRLRNVSKKFPTTPTGSLLLRNMLGLPIRLRQTSIGVLLCFGKNANRAFSEADETLLHLLTNQAAAAIEATWLYQEIRSMFNTATLLYQVSARVLQQERLIDAAGAIAETCYQMTRARAAGIVLLDGENHIEVKVQIDPSGLHPGDSHPLALVRQALSSGQDIISSGENDFTQVCIPLQTPRRQYGALWVEIAEKSWNTPRFADNLHSLANQAAVALERSILLAQTRKQAEDLENAYRELETTYDQTLAALTSALDARDRETEGHSLRVAHMAAALSREMGMSEEQAKRIERGAILHDIGKIGISDTILLKPGPLTHEEWQIMRLHPDIGARIIEGIPFLQDALPIIRYHQERWNGSGYPLGLKGEDIPLMARIFAVVDAYDALTTHRPYRTRISSAEALEYLRQQANILFDPRIVEVFAAHLEARATSKDNPRSDLPVSPEEQ